MKILHVIRSVNPKGGGPIAGVRSIASVLSGRGHDIEIASLDDSAEPFLRDFPLTVHALGKKAMSVYGRSTSMDVWLKANIASYDVVVVNGLWQYHLRAAAKAAVAANVPYFVFCHGMLDPWFNKRYPIKRLKKQVYWLLTEFANLRNASAVLFTCRGEAELAKKSFFPYKVREKIISYGSLSPSMNLIDAEAQFRSSHPALIGSKYLLFLSRVHEKKGVDLLLEAFGQLAQLQSQYFLVIAGPAEPTLKASLEKVVKRYGIESRVIWAGHLDGLSKWGAIAGCELFVLPSYQENFGIALAEAMSAARPVLTTYGVNIWREIKDSGGGIIVQPSVLGIKEGLSQWMALSEADRAGMSVAALGAFHRHFDLSHGALTLEGLYSERIAGRLRPGAS